MEFNHIFSVVQDNELHEVEAHIVFKKVDATFDTGLGYAQVMHNYAIKTFECFCETKAMNYNLEKAVTERYENVFMQRDIDSIND